MRKTFSSGKSGILQKMYRRIKMDTLKKLKRFKTIQNIFFFFKNYTDLFKNFLGTISIKNKTE